MASDRAFLDYVLEQLSPLDGITFRPMMGEYLVYCRGRVIGGVYDDRFLVKPTENALRRMREAGASVETDLPYPGAKPMLVADVDDRELLCSVVEAAAQDLK
ncbi:MAG: TfoX/Sxy family protein [Clostridia bacterium]|nr:TfoX/Sxy family protein [Clostridia bacterium]MCR4906266.1 TfoX/Sxy family protein [Clostridiales bacterium]